MDRNRYSRYVYVSSAVRRFVASAEVVVGGGMRAECRRPILR